MAVAVAALAMALPAPAIAASSATITACVKTKTGVAKILTAKQARKKCPKGSKKMTWKVKPAKGTDGADGRDGANGTNGANGTDAGNGGSGVLQVRDGAGNVLGAFAGARQALLSAVPGVVYTVLSTDGGLYRYLASGALVPNGSPIFRDQLCVGPAYLLYGTSQASPLIGVGAAGRFVYRPYTSLTPEALDYGDLGPARVWKYSARAINFGDLGGGPIFALDPDGTCALQAFVPSDATMLAPLTSIPAPPDGIGPLVVG